MSAATHSRTDARETAATGGAGLGTGAPGSAGSETGNVHGLSVRAWTTRFRNENAVRG
ncbi:hypothetical protein [Amycolatopsis sp. NPDC058986]|uniref:hypothetical protein n=1 Tax=Amycolatopsis sp. NPDC058986 TaxID=3346685 RepID=UPI00366F20B7